MHGFTAPPWADVCSKTTEYAPKSPTPPSGDNQNSIKRLEMMG
jgi:hypothetical protein